MQGGARGQEEDTDDEQPSTSSSGTHQLQPASRSVDSTAVPSPDQPPSTSSLWTDTQQRTIKSPSAGDDVETCVTCSVHCVHKVVFIVLRCYIVMLLLCY